MGVSALPRAPRGSKQLRRRLARYLPQLGGDLRGILRVLPLGGSELGLQGLMSGFEGLNESDVGWLKWPHPPTSLSPALPCKFALHRGKRVLQGLADQPSLPIGDRIEGLDWG